MLYRWRLAVAVETSGSVDGELLARFTAEVTALMRQTGAHVRLIVGDAAVHQVEDFSGAAGIGMLMIFRYQGGGGTAFAPASRSRQIPYTLTGKKMEIPVRRIISGTPPERAASRDAMMDPSALGWYVTFAAKRGVLSAT